MMRKLLSFLMIWMMLPCIALGDALQIDMPCLHPEDEAAFLAGHPGISIEYGQHGPFSTGNDLNAALLTGQMAYDIFTERNVYMDCRQTMARGYCLDLSGSKVIQQAIQRM